MISDERLKIRASIDDSISTRREETKKGTRLFFRKDSRPLFLSLALFVATISASAAERAPWGTYSRQPDAWYRGSEGLRIAANIRSQQSRLGDWPKNVDNSAESYRGDVAAIKGTFDNGATVGELRFLARAFRVTDDARNRDAFLKGLDHIIAEIGRAHV